MTLDIAALKWEQRVRPNGDVIAILAVADFRALVERLREAESRPIEIRTWPTADTSSSPPRVGGASPPELDLDALERRQTHPNNDPNFGFAMMTKGEAIALIKRLREAEADYVRSETAAYAIIEQRDALLEYFENENPEGLKGEEARLYSKTAATLQRVGAYAEAECSGCMGGRCDECPTDDAGYAVMVEKAKAGL